MSEEAVKVAPVVAAPVAVPKPPSAAPVPLSAQVNKAQGAMAPLPAGLATKNTKGITSPWLRALIYGETNARKTSVSAYFGSVEDVRIILTRGEDQLLPLRNAGYEYVHCDTMQKIRFAMQYPERLWADWASRTNRILIIDDLSKIKEMLLAENETTDDGREVKDMRMVHREAKGDMADLMASLFAKPMHVIAIAFASIYENSIQRKESITPDLPPAMSRMLTADFSFVFFIDKEKWMFVTTDRKETYQKKNDKNQVETCSRVTFAKRKLPKELEGKGIVNDLEPMDLLGMWNKIQAAKVVK